jgi:hypothetical protein
VAHNWRLKMTDIVERLKAMANGWLCAGLHDAELPLEAAGEIASLRVQLEYALAHNAAEAEDAGRYVELRDHRLAHALRVWHHNSGGGATGPLEGEHLDAAVDAAKTARLVG